MKDKYEFYKINYRMYILLFKYGNFFIALNDDAIVMNKLFNYKIINKNNFYKIGFPISSLNKIENTLNNNNINYLIIDNQIINKKKNKINNYEKYLDSNNYNLTFSRINRITSFLNENINNININNTLKEIEKIIWKINY